MVTSILCGSIIVSIWIIGSIIIDIKKHNIKYNKYKKIKLSNKSELLKLPIITFSHKYKKYNFVIDSGASNSFIISDCIKEFEGRIGDYNTNIITGGGSIGTAKYLKTYLEYSKVVFPICFLINPHLSKALQKTKEIAGIKVHGLIGFDFLKTYGYDIDFKKLIVYYDI